MESDARPPLNELIEGLPTDAMESHCMQMQQAMCAWREEDLGDELSSSEALFRDHFNITTRRVMVSWPIEELQSIAHQANTCLDEFHHYTVQFEMVRLVVLTWDPDKKPDNSLFEHMQGMWQEQAPTVDQLPGFDELDQYIDELYRLYSALAEVEAGMARLLVLFEQTQQRVCDPSSLLEAYAPEDEDLEQ